MRMHMCYCSLLGSHAAVAMYIGSLGGQGHDQQ